MKIWLRTPETKFGSWLVVYKNLYRAFEEAGVDLVESPGKDIIELWWGDKKDWTWSNKSSFKVGYTLTESRSIKAIKRDRAVRNLEKSDLIICPTFHSSIGIAEAPVSVPIEIVPFGVDTKQFQYRNRQFLDRPFKFLLMGNTHFRKGSWLALEAMIKTFTPNEKVQLTVSCFMGRTSMFRKLEKEYGGHPSIIFDPTKKENPTELYYKHHVLISPHLSEGFGLTIPEALSTGMPAVVSRCSAPLEYFSESFGWWIEMSEDYAPVDRTLKETAGFWRLPDVESLAEKMKIAYNSPDKCKRKAENGSQFVKKHLTWNKTVRRIIKVIEKRKDGQSKKRSYSMGI